LFQKKIFLHGKKENFEEYSLILEFAKFNFPILNNYSVEMRRPCPWHLLHNVLQCLQIILKMN
jgi:hypothetical protein